MLEISVLVKKLVLWRMRMDRRLSVIMMCTAEDGSRCLTMRMAVPREGICLRISLIYRFGIRLLVRIILVLVVINTCLLIVEPPLTTQSTLAPGTLQASISKSTFSQALTENTTRLETAERTTPGHSLTLIARQSSLINHLNRPACANTVTKTTRPTVLNHSSWTSPRRKPFLASLVCGMSNPLETNGLVTMPSSTLTVCTAGRSLTLRLMRVPSVRISQLGRLQMRNRDIPWSAMAMISMEDGRRSMITKTLM
jgi:hypothetical protein